MDPTPAGGPRAAGLLLGVALLVVAGTAAPAAGQAGADAAAIGVAQAGVDADAVLLSATVRADGTAAWRIEYRVRLDDDNATAAFESLQADVEANASAYETRFADRMRPTVEDAAAETGREMELADVDVSTTTQQLPQTYGVLVYTFDWTGFAAVEGDRLRAGDALAGFFLDADSTLIMAWPEGYGMVSASPPPTEERERAVVWRGPTDFGPGEPDLVVARGGPSPATDRSLLGLGVVGLAVLAGAGAWWWRRRRPAGAGADPSVTGDRERPPEELLSNEERVIAVLEDHGGRMKQQDLVDALGWTDAKTSQVVGGMRETGELEGFRLGRENVLRLPEVDESPVDDRNG